MWPVCTLALAGLPTTKLFLFQLNNQGGKTLLVGLLYSYMVPARQPYRQVAVRRFIKKVLHRLPFVQHKLPVYVYPKHVFPACPQLVVCRGQINIRFSNR